MERLRFTVFPENAGQTEFPGGVKVFYEQTYSQIPKPRSEVYVSTPLTSGGAKRLSLGSVAETVQRNSRFVETVIVEAEHLFAEERLTLPHRIGTQKGWGEAEYLRYWMYYLSGVPAEKVGEFEAQVVSGKIIDSQIFNNHGGDKKERLVQYRKLLNGFLDFVGAGGNSLNPVSGIALMPDHQTSLGCSLERELGKALEIPMREIYFDKNHPNFRNQIAPIAEWLLFDYGEHPSPIIEGNGNSIIVFRAGLDQ